MSNTTKWVAVIVSGALGFIIPTYFAWTLYVDHVPQNVATWGMVFALDLLGLILAYRGGNKKPYLQIGWAIAAFCIFVAVILNGDQVRWGWTEIISVILCCVAIVLWLTRSALVAQWAYMAAMYISFVPLMADYWREPQPDTLWLWLWTIASCLLAILGAEKRDFANTFVPWAAIGLNVIITVLCVL
ncbi:MAG: hypothetical protein Q8P17_03960 [bacterium]|nr:hypothetical protein [bacterium]